MLDNQSMFGKNFGYILTLTLLSWIVYTLPSVRDAISVNFSNNAGNLVAAASQNTASRNTTAPLFVTYPNGGELWRIGNWYRVEFKLNNLKLRGPFQVYLDKYYNQQSGTINTPYWSQLLGQTASYLNTYTTEFWYNVPSSLLTTPGPGSTFKIRVCAKSNNVCQSSDSSDGTFTIAPQVVMLYPNGGETLRAGSSYAIYWDKTNVAASMVDLWLLDNPTRLGSVILKNVPNTGSAQWLVAPLGTLTDKDGNAVNPSGQYVMYITCSDFSCVSDDSDGAFTII